MKFLHTGDLHIGKKIFETSLLEDQKLMLQQIYDIAVEEQVDAVLIAGDVYDRSVPATEAVELLDDFLTKLIEHRLPVVLISGNHDSPERVGFADKILERQGLYIAGAYEGCLRKVEFEDPFGKVCVVCLPFVKPAVAGGQNCAEAVERLLDKEDIDFADGKRYVLVTHYFVTGENGKAPELSESETTVDVGGIDNVPADVFQGFDYVALGHIHKYQQIGVGQVYYAGAPMKYSFAEANSSKSVNIVTLGEKGQCQVKRRELKPLHEMRCIKGFLQELIRPEIVKAAGTSTEDFIQATLTDREELIDPIGTLRSVYPNIMQIVREEKSEVSEYVQESMVIRQKNPFVLFDEFYRMVREEEMSVQEQMIMKQIVKQVTGGRE